MDVKTISTELIRMQKALNDKLCGECWETRKTVLSTGLPIRWAKCILVEAGEASDSIGWKHWKDIEDFQKVDWINLKVELIDILHFSISHIIENAYKLNSLTPEDFLAERLKDLEGKFDYNFKTESDKIIKIENLLDEVKFYALGKGKYSFMNIMFKLMELFYLVGYSAEDVFVAYMSKNVLNDLRRLNGYKEGTYIKMWENRDMYDEPVEDNIIVTGILSRLVESNEDVQYDMIKASVFKAYGLFGLDNESLVVYE